VSEVTVHVRGPIFDGRASHAVTRYLHQTRRDVAAQAYSNVMHNLDTSIRHPTPYYETQITTDHRGETEVVNDRGIIYGPWLEGTGSRNSPKTRFRGYRSFRRATATTRREATGLAERTLQHYLPEMR
jgi:hypothetical protein